MRTIALYHFRHFDPLRQRWIMARYVCDAPEIRCRYPDYELIGAPDVPPRLSPARKEVTPARSCLRLAIRERK